MVILTETPRLPGRALGSRYADPVGSGKTSEKPSLYARVMETAGRYPNHVPEEAESAIAEEFRLGKVEIFYKPFGVLVSAMNGKSASEYVVKQGLGNRGYMVEEGDDRARVSIGTREVMVLQRSEGGFNKMIVGDIRRMIRSEDDEDTFDMIADLFAA